jgi:hypothetical protein
VLGFLIPKALHLVVVGMLRERLKNKVLEYCNSPYQNPWFLVKKKSSKYRLVNAAIEINKHSIQDANLLLSINEFSEEFVSC